MRDQHGRNSHGQREGAVQRGARSVGEEHRLNTKLDCRAQGRQAQADPTAHDGRNRGAPALVVQTAVERTEHDSSGKRQHKGHVKAVGAKGQNAAVAKQQRLQRQRDRDSDSRGLGAQQQRDECAADGVACGAAGQRNVKHHEQKGERSANTQKGHMLAIERGAHFLDAVNPYGHHRHRHNGIGLRGQIIIGNMHEPSQSERCVLRFQQSVTPTLHTNKKAHRPQRSTPLQYVRY